MAIAIRAVARDGAAGLRRRSLSAALRAARCPPTPAGGRTQPRLRCQRLVGRRPVDPGAGYLQPRKGST